MSLLLRGLGAIGKAGVSSPKATLSAAHGLKGMLAKAYKPLGGKHLIGKPVTNMIMPQGYEAVEGMARMLREPKWQELYKWSLRSGLPPYAHPVKGEGFLKAYSEMWGGSRSLQDNLNFVLNRNVPFRQGFGLRTQQELGNISYSGGVKGYNPGLVYRAPGGRAGFKKNRVIEFNDPTYYTNKQWDKLSPRDRTAIWQGRGLRESARSTNDMVQRMKGKIATYDRDIKQMREQLKNPLYTGETRQSLKADIDIAGQLRDSAEQQMLNRPYHSVMGGWDMKDPNFYKDIWDFQLNSTKLSSLTDRQRIFKRMSKINPNSNNINKELQGIMNSNGSVVEIRKLVSKILDPVTIQGPYNL